MTVARNWASPAEIKFSRIDDRARVRGIAELVARNLALLERVNGLPATGLPLGVLRAWTGLEVPDGILSAAVAYLGHTVVSDPIAVSADHRVLVTPEQQLGHVEHTVLARAKDRCPQAVQVHLVCETRHYGEDPWMVRGCLERLAARGELEPVEGGGGSVWRVPAAGDRRTGDIASL